MSFEIITPEQQEQAKRHMSRTEIVQETLQVHLSWAFEALEYGRYATVWHQLERLRDIVKEMPQSCGDQRLHECLGCLMPIWDGDYCYLCLHGNEPHHLPPRD